MSERWLRVLAWSIIAVAIAVFSVFTWPAILFVIALGVGICAVAWAILFLVVSYDDSPPEPGDFHR